MRDFMYYFVLLSIIVYPFGIALAVLCPVRRIRRVFLILVAAWFVTSVAGGLFIMVAVPIALALGW
jgi:hypothetical protein